jgi:tRNA-dihydrouridine synthase
VEAAGVSHVAVHGRTPEQKAEPPDLDTIAQVKASLRVPVFANGDCKSYTEALEIAQKTRVDGIT